MADYQKRMKQGGSARKCLPYLRGKVLLDRTLPMKIWVSVGDIDGLLGLGDLQDLQNLHW